MEKDNIVEGFYFEDISEYKAALKEYETIKYVEKKLDMTNRKMVLSIYNKLLLEGSFRTIVGRCYLKNLYDFIVANEIATEDEVPMIKITDSGEKKFQYIILESQLKKEKDKNEKLVKRIENTTNKNSRLKFLCVALAVVIIGLFVIVINSDSVNYFNTKEAVLDNYSQWEKELQEREDKVKSFEEKYGDDLKKYESNEEKSDTKSE